MENLSFLRVLTDIFVKLTGLGGGAAALARLQHFYMYKFARAHKGQLIPLHDLGRGFVNAARITAPCEPHRALFNQPRRFTAAFNKARPPKPDIKPYGLKLCVISQSRFALIRLRHFQSRQRGKG